MNGYPDRPYGLKPWPMRTGSDYTVNAYLTSHRQTNGDLAVGPLTQLAAVLLNKEIKRRTRVLDIFANNASIERPVGAMMMEQNDERVTTAPRRMKLQTIGSVCDDRCVYAVKLAALT